MDNKKITLGSIIVLLALAIFSCFVYVSYFKTEESTIGVKPFLIKSVIEKGELTTSNLKITNLYEFEKNFKIDFKGFEGKVSVNQNSFNLGYGESKDLELTFIDSDYEPGIYVGSLIIKTDIEQVEIPVILEVQSKDILFALSFDIASDYKEIGRGEDILANIKIFNLRDNNPHTVYIDYSVMNFDSEVIVAESETRAVGLETTLTKTIDLPEDLAFGKYVYAVMVNFGDSSSTSTETFSVVKRKNKTLFNTDNFIFLTFVFLCGIIILVFFLFWERNKFFIELKKQHNAEFDMIMKVLAQQKTIAVANVETPEQKQKVIVQYNQAEKEAVKKIKAEHKKQDIELKKLKKQKKKPAYMERKLAQWRKQGFNVDELEMLNKSSRESMKSTINKWKKQGYDTSVLEN